VSPSTIYRAIEAGELDAIKIGGSLRVPADSVRAFEDTATSAGKSGEVA
jgi:excisionase family DNA binding protein